MSWIAEHFREGGWGMWPILFWQVLAIAVIVERTIFLFKSSMNRDEFLAAMQKCILAGDVGRAVKICSAADRPLARIVKAGLMKVNQNDAIVQSGMDESALRELPLIEHRTPYLALLANLAMLSGLLGTVTGLISAFGAVANATAAERGRLLANGISEAMNCTAFGLFAALVALIGFALLNGKTQAIIDDINGATVQVMNMVTNNRSKMQLSQAA